MSLAVSMTGISKRFGSVHALGRVDLQVRQGTIHAVVGENGAGKTTLMRILYGAIQPDEGRIEIDGKLVRFSSSRDAIASGIGMVSQHYGIIPELTCLQNLLLGAEPGLILSRGIQRRAEALAQQMGFRFDWNDPASRLSPGSAQKLEILKLLWRDSRIMILDEPTAMLSPTDGEALFESLRQLASRGATVILVTHRLPEVIRHCASVTVLRNGALAADRVVAETNGVELAQLIVGGAIAEAPRKPPSVGREVLRVSDAVVRGSRGEEALNGVSLSVKSGEVVGVAGVDGSGQRELLRTIAGIATLRSGRIEIAGEDVSTRASKGRIAAGLRIIPEDRHAEGLIEEWSLEENSALGLQRLAPFSFGSAVNAEGRRSAATTIAERFDTRHSGIEMAAGSLSGGNQQRFVAARALFVEPVVILAFQPARGLDLNGTVQVYEGIRDACARGAGALVVSFDLDELLEYCDRVLVMLGGALKSPGTGQERSRDEIGRLMVGAE